MSLLKWLVLVYFWQLHPRRAKAVRSAGLFAFGLIIFVLLPAPMLTYVEGWSYAVSVYYAFITLSTIGLGDYVAGKQGFHI